MGKMIDYTGKKIGMLTVLGRAENKPGCGNVQWRCRCDCGNEVVRSSGVLGQKKGIRSCGCYDYHARQRRDITGQRFGKLVALEPVGKSERARGSIIWRFRCDCGNIIERPHSDVTKKQNPTQSCGCGKKPYIGNSEHGHRYYSNIEEGYKFGTNLNQIRIPDTQLMRNNTSGYTGVSFISTRNEWVAAMRFQGTLVQKSCRSLEAAVAARQEMRKIRDEFLAWYDSLTPEEQQQAALEYEENQSMFKLYYKKRMLQMREEKLLDGRYKESVGWQDNL